MEGKTQLGILNFWEFIGICVHTNRFSGIPYFLFFLPLSIMGTASMIFHHGKCLCHFADCISDVLWKIMEVFFMMEKGKESKK